VIVDVKGDGPAGTAELFRQRLHRFKTPARQCEHFHFGRLGQGFGSTPAHRARRAQQDDLQGLLARNKGFTRPNPVSDSVFNHPVRLITSGCKVKRFSDRAFSSFLLLNTLFAFFPLAASTTGGPRFIVGSMRSLAVLSVQIVDTSKKCPENFRKTPCALFSVV